MSEAILLSGGMDSIALAFWKRPPIALTIDYGQVSAEGEIRASSQVCLELGIRHEVIRADCRHLGSGDLAGVPPNSFAPAPEWWPFRNQYLVTIGAMRAISLGVTSLLFGSVKSDGFHADGRKVFFETLSALLSQQEAGLRVLVPAIEMSSSDLIKRSAIDPGILAWAHSCHTSSYACGRCRGCNKHREVLAELGYEPY